MSAFLETLLTALVLSTLAAWCLALLPHAPPRVRFAVAMAGIAAWLVPWGFIHVAVPDAAAPVAVTAPLTDITRVVARVTTLPIDAATSLACVFTAALLAGLALFAGDCLALRRSVRGWRAASRRADEVRTLLPPELAAVRAEIRVVANSGVAAASGVLTPTIWIGDRHTGARLRLILVHEMWHVRGHDPLWIVLLASLRRAYWWNPLVAHLARQALLMIESTCDHRSAALLGRARYRTELAALVLAGAAPAPRLLAAVQAANLDVERLRLLGTRLHLRARDALFVAALGVCAAAAAGLNVLEPEVAEAAVAATVPARRAPDGNRADVLDDLLSTYAYTPQQHAGEIEQ